MASWSECNTRQPSSTDQIASLPILHSRTTYPTWAEIVSTLARLLTEAIRFDASMVA